MATAKATPEPLTGDAELKEILKNLTGAEIDAITERIAAKKHPEEYLTPERIMAMAATAKAIPEPLTGDPELDAEIENFEKRGNWVEDRKEILKNLTGAEIDAMAARIDAEHQEEYSTPEEIMAMAEEGIEEPQPTKRRVELVGA
jgi:hypothetical protein